MAPPAILYHYRSLAGDGQERTRRTLLESELYFSSLSDFNDPFEARVAMAMDAPEEQWLSTFGTTRPDDDRLRSLIGEVVAGIRADAATLGMFCASGKADDILMWSHYADRHRGLCLGFSTRGSSILSDAREVSYSAAYPAFNYFDTTPKQRAELILLTKAEHWSYEREWRTLSTRGRRCEVFPAGMLEVVILGCDMPEHHQRNVMDWAGRLAPHYVRVLKARRDQSAFAIRFEDVVLT